MKSLKRHTRITYRLILLIMTLWSYAAAQGALYSVIVGVSKYRNSGDNLEFAHLDAIAVHGLLKMHTPLHRLRLLTDEQAKQFDIIKTTEQLFSQAKPEDIVIFYFSGHGNKDVFCAHDRNLDFKDLRRVFKKTKARRKIIFADACYAGTLRTPNQRPNTGGNTSLGKNVLLYLSSRSNQTSYETKGGKWEGGYFTHYLVEGLKGRADVNHDRVITARELFDYVNPRVKKDSRNRQIPVMWGNFDNQMPILSWK